MRNSLGSIANEKRRRNAQLLIGSSVPLGLLWFGWTAWLMADEFSCMGGLLITCTMLFSGLVLLRHAKRADDAS